MHCFFNIEIVEKTCCFIQIPNYTQSMTPPDPFELSEPEFKAYLDESVEPEIVFANAPWIYSFLAGVFRMSCLDSVLREWTFQWYSAKTNQDYEVIYNHWLKGDK